METLLGIIKAAGAIADLIRYIAAKAHDAEQRGAGRREAILEAVGIANQQLTAAAEAEREAAESHAKDATDGAFDSDFMRKG